MLDIPLPILKRQLEEMLLDLQLLATALQRLRDLLPEHSEKRVTVLTLLGRLNDANKKALRGTLDNSALQTEYNAIRADLSDFIQGLEALDFEVSVAPTESPSTKAGGRKQGNVLYRIPHAMPLRQETTCIVRIAHNEDIIGGSLVLDDQFVLKNLTRVSDLMQVEIADPAREPIFTIRSTSPAQQLITEESYTEWFFYVEPLREGTYPLEVKVSVLELAFNQIHRKEIVFCETIQIFTEAVRPFNQPGVVNDKLGAQFKLAGQAFAFGDSIESAAPEMVSESSVQQQPRLQTSGLRTLALFLAFIMLGSTATWAFTPAETRDWWVTKNIKDDKEAYASYIQKHPNSRYREQALFLKAERSQQLAEFRDYQTNYPAGKYREKVAERVSTLEMRAIENIRQNPRRENIQQFAAEFPETERLLEVKEAAEARADNRKELLAEVEEAYVNSVRSKPTAQKIKAYLRDFPQYDRLNEVSAAAATKPEVMVKVQAELEDAYLKKMEQEPTTKQAQEFLDRFPEPLKQEKLEQVLENKPAMKLEAVRKIRKAREMREARDIGN